MFVALVLLCRSVALLFRKASRLRPPLASVDVRVSAKDKPHLEWLDVGDWDVGTNSGSKQRRPETHTASCRTTTKGALGTACSLVVIAFGSAS